MSEFFGVTAGSVAVTSAAQNEYFEVISGQEQLIPLGGVAIEVPSPVVEIIEAQTHASLAIQQPVVELFERSIQGPAGPKGEPADTNIIQASVLGNETKIVDRSPVIGFWAARWLVTGEDDTGARRSLIVDATLNSADPDYVKYGRRGQPVAFKTSVIVDGSDVALSIENRSASDLIFRIIRLETRF